MTAFTNRGRRSVHGRTGVFAWPLCLLLAGMTGGVHAQDPATTDAPASRMPGPSSTPTTFSAAPASPMRGALAPAAPLLDPRLADADVPWPARSELRAALAGHPRIAEAAARARVLAAGADILRAGPHETVVRTTQVRRRVDNPGASYHEWQLGIERALRWPQRAAADRALADRQTAVGASQLEDARHETARELLRGWFAWLRARDEARAAHEQTALAAQLADTVRRRVQAGDAAAMDGALAGAELERVRAQALLARSHVDLAAAWITQRFPEIALAVPDEPPARANDASIPATPPPTERERLRTAYVERHHELALARAEARRASAQVERARAELRPDPSIGAYLASDRGAAERVLGIGVSLPLAGPARDAALRQALADEQARIESARDIERRVLASFDRDWVELTARTAAAFAFAQAASAQQDAARQIGRAYALGESSLPDWLAARRVAGDARAQALSARWDAAETAARLRLDLHELPGFDD